MSSKLIELTRFGTSQSVHINVSQINTVERPHGQNATVVTLHNKEQITVSESPRRISGLMAYGSRS